MTRKFMALLAVFCLLVLAVLPATAQDSTPTLTGVTWQWVGTVTPTDTITVPDSTLYTVTFLDDGSLGLRADCNVGNGTYTTADDSTISIALGAMTLAMCPEGSLDATFTQQLSNVAVYSFQDGDLYIDLAADGGTMQFTAAAPTLTGTVWEWTGTTTPVETITVSDPTRYQVEFLEDGSVALQADCNRAFGSYTTTEDGGLTIQVIGSTMAMCPPDSQADQFIQQLSNSAIYFFQDGNLFIDQAMDSGTMQFRPAGSAPAADPALLQGITWMWTDWMQANTAEAVIPATSYTILFNSDGSVNIQADCNVAFGTYTAADGSISIEVGGVSMAMCPEDSRSQQFLDLLGQVSTYTFTAEGWLVLDLPDDGGTMVLMEAPPPLVGTTWQWVQTMTPDETIVSADPSRYTITFNEDGTYSWQLDCNTGGGSYTLDGQALTLGPGITTLMACPDGSQDAVFSQHISSASSFYFFDGDLYIELGGAGVMQLQAAPPALTGTTWQWQQTVTPVEVIAPTDPASYTILFNEDGSYNLQADCNSGSGTYTVDGQSISIGPAATTRMACPEGSLDSVFLQQISSAAIYFFQNGDLFMDQAMDSGTMQFSAAQ
ncbi:MAG: META domain-containing protein [Anaerolineae bacterium]